MSFEQHGENGRVPAFNFEEYICQGELPQRERAYVWSTAMGLQAVDGLRPSSYLVSLARDHIDGLIAMEDVDQRLASYYEAEGQRLGVSDEHEADIASVNIAHLLKEKVVAFSLPGLLGIHKRIFQGIFTHAGQFREVNITKKEWVLGGDTVLYVSAPDIPAAVTYDLQQERKFDYSGLSREQMVEHIAQFVSGIWQIHPFREGNTRTTAVFTILYLRSLGFEVDNRLFAADSWYFRNALVRSNYQNIQKGIKREFKYLYRFFKNLLLKEDYPLKNRYMHVGYAEGSKAEGIKPKEGIKEGINEGINEGIKLEPIERLVVDKLIENMHITTNELVEQLKVSRSSVERTLKILKEKKAITRVGSRKKGEWRVSFELRR